MSQAKRASVRGCPLRNGSRIQASSREANVRHRSCSGSRFSWHLSFPPGSERTRAAEPCAASMELETEPPSLAPLLEQIRHEMRQSQTSGNVELLRVIQGNGELLHEIQESQQRTKETATTTTTTTTRMESQQRTKETATTTTTRIPATRCAPRGRPRRSSRRPGRSS